MKKESKLPLLLTVVFLAWVVVKAYNYVQDFKRQQVYSPPSFQKPAAKLEPPKTQIQPMIEENVVPQSPKLERPEQNVAPVPPSGEQKPAPASQTLTAPAGNPPESGPPKKIPETSRTSGRLESGH